MPGPSSATRTTRKSGSGSSASVTVTFAVVGVWVSALVTRLPTTWRSRASSQSTTGTSVSDSSLWTAIGRAGRKGGGVGLDGDRPVRLDGAGVVHGVAGDLREVHRGDRQRPLPVQAGEGEQVLHEQAHPLALRLAPVHQPADVVRLPGRALPVELGEPADRGERRAQFVAGVG